MAGTHKVAQFWQGSRRGFTLVELLVAATILGILAVFATVSYRSSAAETRWTQAKSHAEQVAIAVQRFKMDYPNAVFTSTASSFLSNPQGVLTCSADSLGYATQGPFSPIELINCKYLERGDWSNEYFSYFVENGCSDRCGSNYSACVYIKNTARLPSPYNNGKYAYCIDKTGQTKEVKN